MRLVQESLEATLPAQPSADPGPSSNGSSAAEAEAPVESQPERTGTASAASEAATPGPQSAAASNAEPGPALSPAESADGSTARQPSGSIQPEQKSSLPPQQLLRDALAHAHKGTRLPGSSTACVLQLNAASASVSSAVLVGSAWKWPLTDQQLLTCFESLPEQPLGCGLTVLGCALACPVLLASGLQSLLTMQYCRPAMH